MSKTRWSFAPLILAVVACGPSPKKLLEQNRAELAAFLVQVRAKAASLTPHTEDGLTDLRTPLVSAHTHGDTVVITETELANLVKNGERPFHEKTHGGDPMDGIDMSGTSEFVKLATWAVGARMGIEPERLKDSKQARRMLDEFFSVRYLILLRFLSYTAPQETAYDGTKIGFRGGVVEAEARVLDINGGNHGGFRFKAVSSAKIANVRDLTALTSDLLYRAIDAFDEELQKLAPGSSKFRELEGV
jgi:hypothetical protein